MPPVVAVIFGLVAPVVVVWLAGPNYDEPAPPIGWWFVIVAAELVGAVLAIGARS